MTRTDFLALQGSFAEDHAVQASDLLEDQHEITIGDTVIYLQWSADDTRIELTVPLSGMDPQDEWPSSTEALYRLLLQHQWTERDADGVDFGMVPELDEIVGMLTLDADGITGPDNLIQALTDALVEVQAAWFELGAQWLADAVMTPDRAATPTPSGDAAAAPLRV